MQIVDFLAGLSDTQLMNLIDKRFSGTAGHTQTLRNGFDSYLMGLRSQGYSPQAIVRKVDALYGKRFQWTNYTQNGASLLNMTPNEVVALVGYPANLKKVTSSQTGESVVPSKPVPVWVWIVGGIVALFGGYKLFKK